MTTSCLNGPVKWIAKHGLSITPKALALLVDHTGNDLNRLQNEVENLP